MHYVKGKIGFGFSLTCAYRMRRANVFVIVLTLSITSYHYLLLIKALCVQHCASMCHSDED